MALTTERNTTQYGSTADPELLSLPVAAATKIYQGSIVCDNGSGYATKGAVSTALIACGIAEQTVDNTGDAGALQVPVRRGAFWLQNSTGNAVTIAERYSYCYIEDDSIVSKENGGGTRSIAGIVLDVDASQGVLVLVGAATQVVSSTASAKAIQTRSVRIRDEDAAVTGASAAINIGAVLPTGAIVLGHEINIVEQFAGEADTTLTIGGTDADAIVASFDLDAQAPGNISPRTGVHAQGSFSGEQLVATLAATALGDLTAGDMTITVWFFVP
jgi:hypothetical protein